MGVVMLPRRPLTNARSSEDSFHESEGVLQIDEKTDDKGAGRGSERRRSSYLAANVDEDRERTEVLDGATGSVRSKDLRNAADVVEISNRRSGHLDGDWVQVAEAAPAADVLEREELLNGKIHLKEVTRGYGGRRRRTASRARDERFRLNGEIHLKEVTRGYVPPGTRKQEMGVEGGEEEASAVRLRVNHALTALEALLDRLERRFVGERLEDEAASGKATAESFFNGS
ncbi:hypothetical protein L596_013972 [Steinernema carpocapsae]|uniref:Uncharacterized protein n=1 Tax=Steinernema carpocapsae TaxID=34508 RepID=A0A4V6A2J5_STECR|nr:hypothetical protein L596_013972 [Steinernema carpocapsae]